MDEFDHDWLERGGIVAMVDSGEPFVITKGDEKVAVVLPYAVYSELLDAFIDQAVRNVSRRGTGGDPQ